jgi:NADPH2:quinone reductase
MLQVSTIESLGAPVGNVLKRAGVTVAALEATTAGLISSCLQSVPGASKYWQGATLIYSQQAATALVPKNLLRLLGKPSHNYSSGPNYMRSKEIFTTVLGEYFRRKMSVDWFLSESGATDVSTLPKSLKDNGAFTVVTILGPNGISVTKTIKGKHGASRVENMWTFTRAALNLLKETVERAQSETKQPQPKPQTKPQTKPLQLQAELPPTMSALISDVTPGTTHVHFKLVHDYPTPKITGENDIIIRMDASPINPSDIGVIFGNSDRKQAFQKDTNCISTPIDIKHRKTFATDQYGRPRKKGGINCGNEGAGVVVAAGTSLRAQELLGKVVAVFGSGGCYSQYKLASAVGRSINVMPNGIDPIQASSSYVNPLTALGLLSTVALEGHKAVISTAAASQLGQMMVRICMNDDKMPSLINIVRREKQRELLLSINPKAIVLNSSDRNFESKLLVAVVSYNVTAALDATGGGSLSSKLLNAIDTAGLKRSNVVQLYHYGRLDTSPSTMTKEQIRRSEFWLLPIWGSKNKKEFKKNMNIVKERITSTFKTDYTTVIRMDEAVNLNIMKEFEKQRTGKKYLLIPNGGGVFQSYI